MLARLAASALALTAQPLLAACPTAGDLATGIHLYDTDGGIETFTQHSDTSVLSMLDFGDGAGSRAVLLAGVYLVEIVDLENNQPLRDTRTTYSLPLPEGGAPIPSPGGNWTVQGAKMEDGAIDRDTQAYSFGQQTTATIGECSYDMIPINVAYLDESDGYAEIIHYLPSLGISYLVQAGGRDEEPDRFTYTRISTSK